MNNQNPTYATKPAAVSHPAIKPPEPAKLPAVMSERGVSLEQYNVLRNMIFPAAESVEAIAIAIDYCKARGLDIMKKPVHIVPVYDAKQGKNVETVWPSIYEYRATANRTGLYAGKDEPQFGPTKTKVFKPKDKKKSYKNKQNQTVSYDVADLEISFPEYCVVTVYKIVAGTRCPFPGKVYWEEAVVMTNNQPNSMWQKRVHAQLAKCAEAEALRSAFPEELGGLAIAEEMHGQTIHSDDDIADKTVKPKTSRFAERVQEDIQENEPKERIIEGEVLPPDNNQEESENPAAGVESAETGNAETATTDEEVEKWDGKSVHTAEGKSTQKAFKGMLEAFRYLKAIVANHTSKQGRSNVIALNALLLKELVANGHQDLVDGLHAMVDEGKDKEVSHG